MNTRAAAKKRQDARDRALYKKIQQFAGPWAAFLGLSQRWEITFQLEDFPEGSLESGVVYTHYPYLKALIKVSRVYVRTCTPFELEGLVVHELCHIIADSVWGPVKKLVGDATIVGDAIQQSMEMLVDDMMRAFMRLRTDKNGGLIYATS